MTLPLTIGTKAPRFKLPDQTGTIRTLEEFKGRWLVLFFYPKDNTPGCTIESIDFTNHLKKFEKSLTSVLGISADSIKAHCNFIEKKNLKVTLLSDEKHEMLEAYGVWQQKKLYGREFMGIVRNTFLVDPNGKIAFIWTKVKPDGHATEVLAKVQELS